MPERTTRTEVVRAGTPVAAGPVMLLPIERIVLHSDRGGRSAWIAAAKEPYALIVRDAGGIWVIGIGAAVASLDALREEVPGLDAVLAVM